MHFRVVTSQTLGGLAALAACLALALPAAQAQTPFYPGPCANCPHPVPSPAPGPWTGAPIPSQPLMPGADQTQPTKPNTTPANPTTPTTPTTPTNPANPEAANQNQNNADQNQNNADQNQDNSNNNFSGSEGLASGAGSFGSPGGYNDDAIPQTLFRLRYDSETGINRFDRATYMFGTWREGSFHPHALVGNGGIRGIFFDKKATGTQIISDNVSDQILSGYLEYAFNNRLSVFVDVPFQFLRFGPNIEDTAADQTKADQTQFPEKPNEVPNAKSKPEGAGDIQAGFKYALIADPNCRYLTFQLRAYTPTGDPGLGLGTGHYSLEPGLLAYQRLSDRLVVQGELIDWIPIAGGIGAGNVITYGGGIGYDVIQRPNLRVTPVAEVVGWTCLGGTEGINGTIPGTVTPAGANGAPPLVPAINVNGVFVPDDHGFLEANGDTIVNVKLGVRTYIGQNSDIYAGYGHPVTGSRWYEDIVRVEYRLHF